MEFALGRDPATDKVYLSALAPVSVTAGGAGDATAANGDSIDQQAYVYFEGLEFIIYAQAVLADTRSLSVVAKVQKSADNSVWVDVPEVPSQTILVMTDPTGGGGSTMRGAGAIGVPREYLDRRYARVVVTPDLSAASVDTATLTGVAVLHNVSRNSAT